MANTAGRWRLANLKELLPLAFRLPPRESDEAAKLIRRGEKMLEHKHMKFMAITAIVINCGFGLYLLVTAYLYA